MNTGKHSVFFRMIKVAGVLCASVYLTFLTDTYTLNTTLKRLFIYLYFLIFCLLFVWIKKRLIKTEISLRTRFFIFAVASLTMLVFHSSLVPDKGEMIVELQGSEGEVWLSEVVLDGNSSPVMQLLPLEKKGWVYHEEYDDYVYIPENESDENKLVLKTTAKHMELIFASNAWSGKVHVTDSMGGDDEYILRLEGEALQTVSHAVETQKMDFGKMFFFGTGGIFVLAFLFELLFYALYRLQQYLFPPAIQTKDLKHELLESPKADFVSLIMHMVAVFIFFGCMFAERFAPDGYCGSVNFWTETGNGYLRLGRLSAYIVFRILKALDFCVADHQLIPMIFFCVIIAWSSSAFSRMIIRCFTDPPILLSIITHLSVLLAFVNVFFTEMFYFSSFVLDWGMGLFFMTLSLQVFWKCKGKKRIFFTTLLLYISFGFYQAYLGFFVIWGSILILTDYFSISVQNIRKVFSEWILMLLSGGAASVLILLTMKFMVWSGITGTSERSPSADLTKIFNNIETILHGQYRILVDGMSFMRWGIGLVLVMLLISMVSALFKYRLSWRQYLIIGILFLVDYCVIFAPHLVSQEVWLQPRTICSYFSLFTFGFVILSAIHVFHTNRIPFWIPVLLCVFLLSNGFRMQEIIREQCVSNALDRIEAREIVKNIEAYEIENQIKVDTICVHYDANVTWGYEGIRYACEDVNRRLEHVSWALGDCLTYYSGRYFRVETTEDEKHRMLFGDQDWSMLIPEEQFRFEDNVLYIAAY